MFERQRPSGIGPGGIRRERLYDALFTAKRHRSRRVNRRHWARFIRRLRALRVSFVGTAQIYPGVYPRFLWPRTDGLDMTMRQHELEHWTGRRLRFQR